MLCVGKKVFEKVFSANRKKEHVNQEGTEKPFKLGKLLDY